MMKRLITVVWMMLMSCALVCAQDCNCSEIINFVITQVELDAASYHFQVVKSGRQRQYQSHKEDIRAAAKRIRTQRLCQVLVARYLIFFCDDNLTLTFDGNLPFNSFTDTLAIRKYFQKHGPKVVVKKPNKNNPVEGVWYHEDGSQTIAIQRDKSPDHDYVGVITSGDSLFWYPGQVRLELRTESENHYECVLWRNTRRPEIFTAVLSDSTLFIERRLVLHKRKTAIVKPASLGKTILLKSLSSKTNYLRIPSFQQADGVKLDSILSQQRDSILGKENLIIDLRGNTGGTNRAYQSLVPFIFTSKVVPGVLRSSMWVGKTALALLAKYQYEGCKTKQDSVYHDEYMARMRQQEGKFSEYLFYSMHYDTAYQSPANVAVLIDRNVSAAAEDFLILAKESSKVHLYGENTFGSIGYANVTPVPVPGLGWAVAIPLSKTYVHDNSIYEFIGVTPDFPLDAAETDSWMENVRRKLEGIGDK